MARIRLLMGSYAPLFALLAIRFTDPRLVGGCVTLFAIGVIGVATLLTAQRREEPSPHHLVRARDESAQVAAYLATYLLPFLTVAKPSLRDVMAYVAFLGLVGVILIRTNCLQVNPLLALMGFRVFEVSTDSGWTGYVISDHTLTARDDIHAVSAAPGLLRVTTRVTEALDHG